MNGALDFSYKRDLTNNYMVIRKDTDNDYSSFCIKMLQRQEIKGILPVEQRRIDNNLLLYYDITAKQAISNILDKSSLSVKALRTLCSGIFYAIEISHEYLLPEDDFILNPDFIYQDISSETPYLCLYPGYGINLMEQMSGLMEYLMNKVDYNDKDAVYLVYRLYAVSKEEGYTLEHLKEVLPEKDKSRQERAERERAERETAERETAERETESTSDSHPFTDKYDNGFNETKQGKEKGSYSRPEHIRVRVRERESQKEREKNIPVVMEKVEGEVEVSCYPLRSYLYAAAALLAGAAALVMSVAAKLIYNSLGTRLDYSKLAAMLLVLGCLEGYLMSKIFDKKNRVTKMVRTEEYIDPRSDESVYPAAVISTDMPGTEDIMRIRNAENVDNEDISATCLLNACPKAESMPVLRAMDKNNYIDIPVTSYPFFIGKLKKNVDFYLNSDTVSRYHAKITKEGESLFLTDLNSTNGTFINDEQLFTYQKKEINYGDVISFADIKYQFMQE